jgi:hypothetical protein
MRLSGTDETLLSTLVDRGWGEFALASISNSPHPTPGGVE